jgi:hypothetical protein
MLTRGRSFFFNCQPLCLEDVDFLNPGFPIKPFGNDELDFAGTSNTSKASTTE